MALGSIAELRVATPKVNTISVFGNLGFKVAWPIQDSKSNPPKNYECEKDRHTIMDVSKAVNFTYPTPSFLHKKQRSPGPHFSVRHDTLNPNMRVTYHILFYISYKNEIF